MMDDAIEIAKQRKIKKLMKKLKTEEEKGLAQ